jgi:hypothetical protein
MRSGPQAASATKLPMVEPALKKGGLSGSHWLFAFKCS